MGLTPPEGRSATGPTPTVPAELLVIAGSTAKTHVKRIMAKIGARDRAQAVVYAYRAGLVAPGRPGRHDRRA